MKIVLTGGGSGGHITPLLVVASELKRQDSSLKIIYVGQKGDSFSDIPAKDPNINETYSVRAGKFRRYHGEGLRQLIDLSTILKNIRDAGYLLAGLVQSYRLMRKIKPDVVFSRGGFVSVPVCLGAKLNGVKYITHDSDPVLSLTNKILAPWAKLHFVALSKDIYPYPQDKTITTGIPVSRSFVPVTKEVQGTYRQKQNIPRDAKVIFVIGGGQGAQDINEALHEILPNILEEFKDLRVIHVVGRKNDDSARQVIAEQLSEEQQKRVEIIDFTDQVYLYSGAADIVVTRAGATNLAEFEIQGLACIVIPATVLVGGHQLQNAQVLEDNEAAVVINDQSLAENPHILAKEISELLKNSKKRQIISENLAKFAHPNAGKKIADLIIQAAKE